MPKTLAKNNRKEGKVMKSTKNKLLSSIATLLVCFAMLIGSTYAWFTDTASTGVNTIQAGNLDIELKYYNSSNGSWEEVTSDIKLFDDNALWEPGHTEVAYLHIKNAGSLDLKYKMNVNIPSETGSINQKGNAFKLSDYLVFGKVSMADANSKYSNDASGRAAARTAAGTTMGLSSWTKAGNLYVDSTNGANEEFFALVIYMPETVGNEANHRKDTPAPQIQLGVNIVATQLNSESDSFRSDYDANADGNPDNGAAWNMAAFRAVADVPSDVTTAGMTITKYENDVVSDENKIAEVVIPNGTASSASLTTDDKVALSVTPADIPAGITVQPDQAAFNFDVKLMKVSSNNTETPIASVGNPVTVKLKVGTGLSGVKIFHTSNGVTSEVNGVTYNSETGIAEFNTESFSDYTVIYRTKKVTGDIVVTIDGEPKAFNVADYEEEVIRWNNGTYVDSVNGWAINQAGGPFNAEYVTLCHAFWAASNGLGNVETSIVLNTDLETQGKYYSDIFRSDEEGTFTQSGHTAMKYFAEIPNVTLDLNGHTIKMDAASPYGSAISVYNANLTIKDSADGGGISSHCYSTICHLGNTVITIEGGTFITDAINGSYHGMAIMSGGDYVENATADGYMPGQIKLIGGTFTFDYMDGNGGTPENPATVKQHYSSYPQRYEGYDENTPIGVFFYLEDKEIPEGYTYTDNHNGTFTVIRS